MHTGTQHPSTTAAAGAKGSKGKSKDEDGEDEDSAAYLAKDLELQRLISESHILSAAGGNAAYYTSRTGSAVGANPSAPDRLFAAGRGVKKDVVEAAHWHILARAAGIKDSWLDGILATLTPAERAKVEEIVRRQMQ